jgi:uncharacterized membrane protein
MNLNKSTGLALRYGVYLAMTVMIFGVFILQLDEQIGNSIIYAGVALLILTPFFSIIVSTVAMYIERDFVWLPVALFVLLITTLGIIIAFFD